MWRKQYLLTPGPTSVPESVLAATARPVIHHRTGAFAEVLAEVRRELSYVFQTGEEVLILTASGTGAMEAAMVNAFAPGQKVLVVNGGKFGERWLNIAAAFGIEVVEIAVSWGEAVDPAVVAQALNEDPSIRGVLVQASESSTTVAHPIEQLAAITRDRPNCLLVVDAVSALGAMDLPMDAWGIDILLAGSQKALMLPPGLAYVALSPKAWEMVEANRSGGRFYFDLKKALKQQKNNSSAFTPAVSLVIGQLEALRQIKEEGIEACFARHQLLAYATRSALTAMGLTLLAPTSPSPSVTGAFVPDGVDSGKLVKLMREEMGVAIAGGQDQLKGRIVRLSHMGHFGAFDLITGMAALEMGLRRLGAKIALGSGVARAQEIIEAQEAAAGAVRG
ncbi:MAG: aminotransferase [Alphaproteobacteria bacterium CG_4_10_14_0_2_um_filter_63_37]|nr:MAG: class V aminotransferase [Proteobacteria bacterium CG1_02_64_396]PJA25116.1 MAG: aminotransferase [Alphaproteobacteria bacterium CG_4_10_14_0_2_um_filter_63_37]